MNAMHFEAARQLSLGGGVSSSEEEDAEEVQTTEVPIKSLEGHMARKAAAALQERNLSYRRPLALKCRKKKVRPAEANVLQGLGDSDSSDSSEDGAQSTSATSSSSNDSAAPKQRSAKGKNWGELLKRRLPVCAWAPQLSGKTLQADLIAGLTVGVMVIPQGMSYANIADLPYIVGMYSACVPAFVYAFLGQSRQLAVGPVAMVSLMLQVGLDGILTPEQCPQWYDLGGASQAKSQSEVCPEAYAGAAFLTSLVLGVIEVLASVLGLSFLVTFLGHPVISGFSSGAAVIIGLSQFKYMLGVKVPRSEDIFKTLANLARAVPEANWKSVLLGFSWLAFLFGSKKLSQRVPRLRFIGPLSPLVSCTAGIVLLAFCRPLREDCGDKCIEYIGDIPSGMIPLSIGSLNLANVPAVVRTALTASLIGFMESIAISKNLASQHGYSLEAGQELMALGVANIAGSFFSCYPVTGSFSRSAVNNTTGAQTQLSGLVTSLVMLCTLLFLTPLFYYLPMFALAAIVINSVISLVAYDVAIDLYTVKKYDFLLWVLAFTGTLVLGVLPGVLAAVIMSLGVVIYESVRPSITVLWRVPGTTMYRSIDQESRGALVPNMFIARIGASMYFANSSYIKDCLLAFVADLEEFYPVHFIVLDMSSVNSMDSTAVHTVRDIVQDFRHRGIEIAFVTVGSYVEKVMNRARVLQVIGSRWLFHSVHAAVRSCLVRQHRASLGLYGRSGSGLELEALADGGAVYPRKSRKTESVVHVGGHEVGFSNEVHPAVTVAYVELHRYIPGISDIVLGVFRQSGMEVPRQEIAGLTHTYFVQANDGNGRGARKLTDEEMEGVKGELDVVIGRCSSCAYPADARTLELEKELQEARERIQVLEDQLQGTPDRGRLKRIQSARTNFEGHLA